MERLALIAFVLRFALIALAILAIIGVTLAVEHLRFVWLP